MFETNDKPYGVDIELRDILMKIIGGGTPSRIILKYWEGTIPWASVKDFDDETFFLKGTQEKISDQGLKASAANLIPAGIPVICARMAVGRCGLTKEPTAINQDLKALFPISDVDSKYFLWLLKYSAPSLLKQAVGSTVPGISVNQIQSLTLYKICDIEKQRAIVTILNTMDEAIHQTEAVIAKLRQVKAGMLHDLLTRGLDENGELRDPLRHPGQFKKSQLGKIPREWDIQPLKSVCQKIQDGTHFSPSTTSGPRLYITSKNVRFGFMDLSDVGWISQKEHEEIFRRCNVRKGDVLLTKDGASTGNAGINELEEEFSLLSSVALLRCDEIKLHNQFLLQTLLSPMFQRNIQDSMSGNAITRLTLEKINNFQIALPCYEEQLRISCCINSLQKKLAIEEKDCKKLSFSKQGLMHDLLTGSVRVPPHLLEAMP